MYHVALACNGFRISDSTFFIFAYLASHLSRPRLSPLPLPFPFAHLCTPLLTFACLCLSLLTFLQTNKQAHRRTFVCLTCVPAPPRTLTSRRSRAQQFKHSPLFVFSVGFFVLFFGLLVCLFVGLFVLFGSMCFSSFHCYLCFSACWEQNWLSVCLSVSLFPCLF
jgi:hypothetical protein